MKQPKLQAVASAEQPRFWRTPVLQVLIGALLLGIMVGGESLVALAIVILDGGVAFAVLAAAALSGGWIVRLLGLGREPAAVRLVLDAGVGIGLLSLIVLGFGAAGHLNRLTAVALAVALGVLGLFSLVTTFGAAAGPNESAASTNRARSASEGPLPAPRTPAFHWMWMLICPFLAITLLAASLPPGVLWQEEGGGYDVLEYHLAVPKAFHDLGRITFLPDNVYSNFPLNSEMLSLLMMWLRGDAIEASFMATMVNVGLAALWVAAAWMAGHAFSSRVGVIAGVLAASSPWIAYLSGIAYVETGMLAMGMCSLAAILRAARSDQRRQWLFAAGLLAGLACGFKYTAAPMIAIPLAGLALITNKKTTEADRLAAPRRKARGQLPIALFLFVLGAAATFSPWLIRNHHNTGNPVFPLAYSIFGAKDKLWDQEMDAHWQRIHGSAAAEQSDVPMWQRAVRRTIGDSRLGVLLFILAAIGAWKHRDRWTLGLLAMLAWQFGFWLLDTHLFARFAVVVLLPLVILAARAVENTSVADKQLNGAAACRGGDAAPPPRHAAALIVYALVIVAAACNLYQLGTLYYHHTRVGGEPINAYGRTDWFVRGEWPGMQYLGAINALGPASNVMLVGEARGFYVRPPHECPTVFNRHPLADAAQRDPRGEAVMQWLRQRGTTHLLVHWGEIRRLAKSYGFYAALCPREDEHAEPDLYERLVKAGLRPLDSFSSREGEPPYATLFEVPRHE